MQSTFLSPGAANQYSAPLIENAKQALYSIENVSISGYNKHSDRKALYYYHPLKRGRDWLEGLSAVYTNNNTIFRKV
jgi:hypothetical protein